MATNISLSQLISPDLDYCCDVLFRRDVSRYDRVVVVLESILSALRLEDSYNSAPWITQTITDIQSAVELIDRSMETSVENLTPRRGRRRIEIPGSVVEELIYLKLCVPKIAETFGVSVSTIRRVMGENNLSIGMTFTAISQEELERAIASIFLLHPNTGFKMMKGFLWQYGQIRISEARLRDTVRLVDPIGVHQRYVQNRAIVRRVYFVTYSNELWHLDTNMKLTDYRMIIRGCIDGKSRLGLYLDVGDNNRATTSLESFMSAVNSYGFPSRVRTDKGGENVLIARFQLQTRGFERGSHITGRSVHNQRIERYWNDVYRTTGFYYETFVSMREEGLLNIDDHNHMYVLHRVYIPRIQRALDNFRHGWNHHPLSSEHNQTPAQLFVLHRAPSDHELLISEEAVHETYVRCQTYHDIDYFNHDDQDTTRHPARIFHSFSLDQLDILDSVDVLQVSSSNGVDIFQHCMSLLGY